MRSVLLACVVTLFAASSSRSADPAAPIGLLAFSHQGPDDRSAIWLVVDDGSGVTNKPRLGMDVSLYPHWSSDGRRLLFRRQSGTYAAEIENDAGFIPAFGVARRLNRFVAASGLDWSPDGTSLVLTREVQRRLCTDLFTLRVNGSRARRLTASAGCEKHPAWSPDGGRIAFERQGEDETDVFVSNVRGGGIREVGVGTYPTWSPDGRALAFLSEDAIVILDARTWALERTLRPEQPLDEVEDGLSWAPDGSRLAYGFLDPDETFPLTHLASIDVDGGDATRLTPLSAYPDADADWRPQCTLYGTNRPDFLDGDADEDILCGLRGSDRIRAGDGDDVVYGGDGADGLVGGLGTDWLFGAAGDDRIYARDGVADLVDGGPGVDHAVVDASDHVSGVERVDRR
jgi:Tol biopolymer transport system component